MAVFMYSFIAYTPEHRCKILECDQDGWMEGGDFNILNFTHPSDEDESSCEHYKYVLVSKYCILWL